MNEGGGLNAKNGMRGSEILPASGLRAVNVLASSMDASKWDVVLCFCGSGPMRISRAKSRPMICGRRVGVGRPGMTDGGGSSSGGSGPSSRPGSGERDGGDNADGTPGLPNVLLSFFTLDKNRLSESLRGSWEALKRLPAQYVSLITAILTILLNRRIKLSFEQEEKIRKEEERLSKKKRDRAEELHAFFEKYSRRTLTTAGELSERLYAIGMGLDGAHPESTVDGPLFSAFLVARFLGSVETMRKEHPSMDFGRPNADRLFANLLHKVDRAFGLSYSSLEQRSPSYGRQGTFGSGFDLLRIPSSRQRSMGELMRQSRWKDTVLEIGDVASGGIGVHDRLLTFPDFLHLYRTRGEFRSWFQPLVEDFSRATQAGRGKRNRWCIRLGIIQSTLMDVVDFLDPEPRAEKFHLHRRARLVGPIDNALDLPESIRKLYRDTAELMSGSLSAVTSLSLDKGSDVVRLYVKASENRYSENDPTESGDCPFSQRVMLFLLESGIPHRLISIGSGSKAPSWYLNLHPYGTVPVMEHGNSIVEDSGAIIQYLRENFPEPCRKIPTCSLPRGTTERNLSEFRRAFYYWLRGERGMNAKSVTTQLRWLEDALRKRPNISEGPFFGGSSLCDVDISILPHLHRLSVAGRELKVGTIPRRTPIRMESEDESPQPRDTKFQRSCPPFMDISRRQRTTRIFFPPCPPQVRCWSVMKESCIGNENDKPVGFIDL